MFSIEHLPASITVSNANDSFAFDLSHWMTPTDTALLYVIRPESASVSAATFTQKGSKVFWYPSAADVATAGTGKLIIRASTTVPKSAILPFVVPNTPENIHSDVDTKYVTASAAITALEGVTHLFKVVFDTDGGSTAPDTQYVNEGAKVTEPEDPTLSDHTFAGWSADGVTVWKFDADVVTDATTLTALWLEQFTVTYDANTGTGTITDEDSPYTDGDEVTVLAYTGLTPPTDKVFVKWNTAANGSGTDYAPAAKFVISADVTLYAQWGDGE